MSATDELRRLLDERGVKWHELVNISNCVFTVYESPIFGDIAAMDNDGTLYYHELNGIDVEPEQAILVTLGRPKAKSHPYGYERDTGAYDCTRCECGCINDISATYCNDCGGEIEIDESAEKEYYDGYSKHTVFAKKHDDGSLEFCERRYVPEESVTHGTLTAEQVMAIAGRHQPDYCSDTHVCFDWQAIAATLGGRECVITPIAPGSDMGRCSTCEQVADVHSNYCWKCGAKVVKR